MDNKAGGPNTSEGMLANFFNSLLNKKTGAAGSPRPGIHLVQDKSTIFAFYVR